MGLNVKKLKTLKYSFALIFFFSLAISSKIFAVKFYSVNSLFGISMREVNSVCEDDNGFVWASSKAGILRLTKYNYRAYQLPYEIPNVFKVRLVYKNSKLLVYTNNGQIFLYNSIFDRFELLTDVSRFFEKNGLLVFEILIDDSGTWWISSSGGIYKYQSGKLSLVFQFSSTRYATGWIDNLQIVIAKQDGIWLFDLKNTKAKLIFKNSPSIAFDFYSIYLDKRQKQIWLTTRTLGLFIYDFASGTCSPLLESVLPKQPILAIAENSDSTCLIGYDGQGIWELNRRNKKVINVYKENLDDSYSLRGNGVYDLFCDKNKRIWVCTYSGGLSFFDQASTQVNQIVHLVNNSNSLINNDINGVIEDKWGKLWFATNNGISWWDPVSKKWNAFYNDERTKAQVFMTLCEDNNGQIWASTYSSGVYVLDGKTGRELKHYSKNDIGSPLESDFVISIFKDRDGDIWMGGLEAPVICYRVKENKFRTYSREYIGCITELSENQILLGCSNGLSLLNKQTGSSKRLLTDLMIRDLQVINENIWICTGGGGLLRYNLKTGLTEKFTTQQGLPSNFVNSIIYSDNYLWLGTEGGLCRFSLKDKNVFTYSSIYSLSHTSFNSASRFKLKNGQLAYGTNNGAIIFSSDLTNETHTKGKIFLQDLIISGRSIRNIPSFKLNTPIDSLKEVSLKSFQNTINLELISIGQSSGSKFSWKLDGFDQQWSPPSENTVITYTNLPSGHFTLKIKLYDNSLTKVMDKHIIKINLIPPFWKTIWFLILLLVIISGIVILYFLYYINRLKQKHTEEKVRFFTNTAHDIRTSLTLIKAPVEELSRETNLSESGKQYLHLAIEQARRLSSVVTQLMDFQKVDVGKEQLMLSMKDIVKLVSNRKVMLASYSKSKNIELVFVSDRDSYMTAIDEAKMEKIIDNLISNAIKYSPDNCQIQIELKCEDKRWALQVKDNGIGITKKAQRQLFKEFYRGDNAINSKVVGSGIGLLLVKNYVTMHGGNISCSSEENIGSIFEVVIPYKSVSIESAATNVHSDFPSASIPIEDVTRQIEMEAEIQTSKEMKVLIVEDNDDLLSFMKSTLSHDFKVFTAVDGEKAWEFISKQIPDLVVSDIMMPNMDGFELCRLMKSTYETSHIPIVLLTALSEKTDQLHGLGLGADDYLTKPFDMNLLIHRIKSIIRNREVVREKALKLINGDRTENILTNELNDKFIKKMLVVARANISNSQFDKDQFASKMNVSSSLLYKKVKSLTDQSPTDFIKTIRLNHSVELLQTRKYTVTEVSELCGFTGAGYFSTVFRKHFGKSPSEILE